MWTKANPCGLSKAALQSLEEQRGPGWDQLQVRTSSRMEPPHRHPRGAAGYSQAAAPSGFYPSAQVWDAPSWAPYCCHSFQARVGRGAWAAMGDVGPPGPVPAARAAQPAWGPRCCCCRGAVDSDGHWIPRRRAGSGLWLQPWGAKAAGGKAGITATDPPVPPSAGAGASQSTLRRAPAAPGHSETSTGRR